MKLDDKIRDEWTQIVNEEIIRLQPIQKKENLVNTHLPEGLIFLF